MLFNPKSHSSSITGRNVAHGRRTPSQRAAIAAEIVKGDIVLVEPTLKQAAELLDVSVPYIRTALSATSAERTALAQGDLLISQLLNPSCPDQLILTWNAATDSERVEFAQRIGVGRIWDEAIAPAIG
jgi:hypothetical protein